MNNLFQNEIFVSKELVLFILKSEFWIQVHHFQGNLLAPPVDCKELKQQDIAGAAVIGHDSREVMRSPNQVVVLTGPPLFGIVSRGRTGRQNRAAGGGRRAAVRASRARSMGLWAGMGLDQPWRCCLWNSPSTPQTRAPHTS